jgi:hypothetical protein
VWDWINLAAPRRGDHARLAVAWFAAGTLACGGDSRVLAPPPAKLFERDVNAPPELPMTVVDVPILLDLSTALTLLETELPRHLGNIDNKQPVPGKKRASYAFEVRREPFRVTVKADTFLIGATLHYQGRGWFDPPIGPEISGSCGLDGPKPRARIVVAIRPGLTRDWQLRANPRLVYLGPLTTTDRDQCHVTFLKLDMTSKVISAASDAIRGQLPRLSAKLATVDAKSEFEKVWNEIQKPIHLADSVWLILDPSGVRLGALSGTTEMLGGTIGISARPKIETGPKPPVALRALPPLDTAKAATGLNLLVQGRFDYDVISRSLTDALQGKTIATPGGSVVLQEIGAFGVGGGRLALGVRFAGTATGQIFFVGTPRYDSTSGRITVPDLDYDASTTPLLVKGVAWLQSAQIRDYLRQKATFPSSDAMERLTTLAVKGMNRELTAGIFLTASVNETKVIAIVPRQDALYLQAHSTGQAALHVTDAFFGKFLAKGDTTPVPPHPTGSP